MEKKKIKRISNANVIILLLLLVAVFSVSTYVIYNSLKPAEIKTIEMHLTVGNYTGFDINTSALIFGTVMPSSYAKRIINVTNIDENVHKIYLKPGGKLAAWTSISENKFILKRDESKQIEVRIDVPNNAEYGKYNGSLNIVFS